MSDRIVFAVGVWDLFHIGHLKFLQRAAKLGDQLVVGVLTDEAVKAYKGPPIIPYEERKQIILALRIVDSVRTVRDSDATPELEKLAMRNYCGVGNITLVHGTDWHEGWEIGQTYLQDRGGTFALLPYTEEQSTTKIKNKIRRRK